MKTKLPPAVLNFWLMLTEVPGWPEAPLWARLRRASPVLVPCAGMLLLAGWHFTIHQPRVKAETALARPLLMLEDEIAQLQIACSEQQVAELADKAGAAGRTLFDSTADITAFLRGLKSEAAERGFDASFIAADTSDEPAPDGARVNFVPVRGRLVTTPANAEPFVQLLAVLERFATSGKRIDLMRLAIRADDQKWHTVEMNFRLVRPVAYEKAPQ